MLDSGELLSGRYRLEELLGRGGMGEVWRATDLRLARTVAIKACLAEPDARFTTEARVMASLHHPSIVNIYDYGDFYLVMEFVDGQPLSSLLDERGHLDSATTARLISQVAEALQVVHEKGIVHRDVKPANILLDSAGNAKLTDFGVASYGSLGDAVEGTARYMAPEQAMGRPVTPAADIYALGAVAYHCLAGFPPFGGEDAVQIALRHIQEPPPPLPEGTSPALRHAVTRAMSKDPADRFPTASAFASALALRSSLDSTSAMSPAGLSTRPLAPAFDTALDTAFEPARVPVPEPAYDPGFGPAHGPASAPASDPNRDKRRRRGALATILAAIALVTLGGLLIAANLSNTPTGENPVQPPAAPASNRPGPTPVVTEQVRRSTPAPAISRNPPPTTSAPSPTPARTTNSPATPQSPAEPTGGAPTSPPP